MSTDGEFIYHELLTTDAEAAANFYAPVLGSALARVEATEHGFSVVDANRETLVGIRNLPADTGGFLQRPTWLGWIAVDDLDRAIEKIAAANGSRLTSPSDIAGLERSAIVADPQGAVFCVVQNLAGAKPPSPARDKVGHCQWNELVTSDQPAAWSFYGELFGWYKGDVIPLGPAGDYELLEHKSESIGAIAPLQQARRPMWIYHFKVGESDETVTRIREGGGTVSYGPAEGRDGTSTIMGRDPQGVLFALSASR